MSDEGLNAMGRWYRLVHSCDCGSEEPYDRWHSDEQGNRLFKVCKRCEERKISEYNKKAKSKDT